MKCRDCEQTAVAVDDDYDEGYCKYHLDIQQASSEPIENVRYL